MIRQYETTIVIDAHLPAEHVDTTISKYSKLLEDNKGKIELVDRWGKRRLAYEIDKKQYGYYIYVRFEVDGTFIKELEREFKLDDSILRYLTVLVPKVVIKKKSDRPSKAREEKPQPSSTATAASDDPNPKEEEPSDDPNPKEEEPSDDPNPTEEEPSDDIQKVEKENHAEKDVSEPNDNS